MKRKSTKGRKQLIKMSIEARKQQSIIEAQTGERPSINQILLDMHKAASGCNTFRLFDQWCALGYRIKPKSKAFRIWGTPRKGRRPQKADNATQTNPGADSYDFYPVCCLYNEDQVVKLDAVTH
ncbi:hypothetical protein [Alteromonas macleodii]|uniref:Uncharacterized protein n=1 Tax=Alteromonas macleodii TaxID=28108 RepID=A0AB36FQW2_ALTMA|nr:hypothetical protein [Alteromonas macleodii]OES24238.1 hypothetical protein BFV93_4838 [Alteromonas macleodii]OES24869.1 hypothetical protein BFV95_4628 [Alteromonas macleodii]OES25147.1 hypothetical protein BFV94_4618 [Alteromonas macleodii]OES39188.1 hypothetical protein BFV96_4336 [Alteromonas macleodii]